ncbi:YxiJ family protein [Psychrobacillus sp. L3]|uniref:YxiJ family protein n=1 Tax=Psychrobacillus sp. L3 TaxID=3236891 RepID=UPI0036F3379E
MDSIVKQLTDIEKELSKPFPYRDTNKIQEDFSEDFSMLLEDEDCLTADFNTYCMNIAGTLSYVLVEQTSQVPKHNIKDLEMTFFQHFKQYKFLEDKIDNYKEFFQEYKNFEKTRQLLLLLLKK